MQELNNDFIIFKSRQRKLDQKYTPKTQFNADTAAVEKFSLDDFDEDCDTVD